LSSLVIVLKKNGKLKMCADYHKWMLKPKRIHFLYLFWIFP
jgi:hypothetical protein